MSDIERVWRYWLEPKPSSEAELQARFKIWFTGGPDVDAAIKSQFGDLVTQARSGALNAWAQTARGRLALIILLDQFSRNIYRGSAEAFSKDPVALELARDGFDSGLFQEFDAFEQLFAYLPFSHAEDLQHQRRAVFQAQHAALGARPEWRKSLQGTVDFARKHLDVIARFGRFPHRNTTLGRTNTAEEQQYLDYLESVDQWL